MLEEGGEKSFFVADAIGRLKELVSQFVLVLRREVGHRHIFRVMPARFDRVQFRRVGREEIEVEPVRMLVVKKRRGGMMSRKIVPDQDDLATIITVNFVQPIDAFVRVHAVRKQGETKSEIKTSGRDRQKTQTGGTLFLGSFDQGRRFTDRSPGRAAIGRKRKTALVP